MLYFLPRSANSCGRFIIQYLDSSAGMVQPTLMVCWANAEPLLSNAPSARAATTPRFDAIRFILNSSVFSDPAAVRNECNSLAEALPTHNCFMLQMIAQYASLWAILKQTG